ncbi:hypothetical protein [Streptomyces sp. NPDC101165]
MFCTALGRAAEAYRDQVFLTHLSGGIAWAERLCE